MEEDKEKNRERERGPSQSDSDESGGEVAEFAGSCAEGVKGTRTVSLFKNKYVYNAKGAYRFQRKEERQPEEKRIRPQAKASMPELKKYVRSHRYI